MAIDPGCAFHEGRGGVARIDMQIFPLGLCRPAVTGVAVSRGAPVVWGADCCIDARPPTPPEHHDRSDAVARVAVDVVIKPEILDPQGKAIESALRRSGAAGVLSVRAGKHFDLEVDDSLSDADLEALAATVLANPVIETWTVNRIGVDPSTGAATGIDE
jgi:phosphoribosylformylglycinamidine synthase subunit PurS